MPWCMCKSKRKRKRREKTEKKRPAAYPCIYRWSWGWDSWVQFLDCSDCRIAVWQQGYHCIVFAARTEPRRATIFVSSWHSRVSAIAINFDASDKMHPRYLPLNMHHSPSQPGRILFLKLFIKYTLLTNRSFPNLYAGWVGRLNPGNNPKVLINS